MKIYVFGRIGTANLGEKIAFFIHEDENGGIALCSNMNPSQKITAEDLEDETMLESSIHNFIREKNQDHFWDILKYDEDLFFLFSPIRKLYEITPCIRKRNRR